MSRNMVLLGALIGVLGAGSFVAGQRVQRGADAEQLAVIEQQIVTVHDTVEHYDTLLRVDTIRLRIAEAHADTVRDTARVRIAELDSAAKADSVVPAAIAHKAALACSDAILSDSVALAAARAALRDCYVARTWSDSGRVLAEQRAKVIEGTVSHARWAGRREGAIAGALAALIVNHILK
jgi:hypothetical protein